MTPEMDIQKNKMMAVICYIYILFLVPMLTGLHKTSAFVKFHLNQGLTLAIGWVGWTVIGIILSSVIKVQRSVSFWGIAIPYARVTPGWLIVIIWIIHLLFCVLAVIGIINAINGKFKGLPIVEDKITLIK